MRDAPDALGQHVIADCYGVADALLRDAVALEALLRQCAADAGARVIGSHFHSFGSGLGVTGVVLLAESHISVHTWPEAGFAAADLFMCGSAQVGRALATLLAGLAPARQRVETVARGLVRI
jgi:S-adenosylmethionine decarboxylase